jgi:TatD DNase family protein
MNTGPYFDSHCHLAMKEFAADADAAIARARAAGVDELLVVSASQDDFSAVRDFARAHALPCALGLHPHEAVHWDKAEPGLEATWPSPECRLVGEIGLDYFYEHSPRETQRKVFAAQLARAAALGKRVVIHSRDAAEDTLALLREHRPQLDAALPGVIHCFTDTAASAEALLELGFMISFSGIITFKKAENVRAAAAIVPPGRLLYETDSPFLAPIPHRGKRNEPAYAPLVLQALSTIHSFPLPELAAVTLQNFHRLIA